VTPSTSTASPAAALALRLNFLFHALQLELLPPALARLAGRLHADQDESSLRRAVADLRSAFLAARPSLALDGVTWPEIADGHLRPTVRAALEGCAADAPPRTRAEALGRFCEALLHDRRASGSYYTPAWIADEIARTVVSGLLEGRGLRADDLLSLRILDPAIGAGAFAIAALEAIAEAMGEERSGNDVRRAAVWCIFGIELNALAADACRLAVWLCASRPGRPATIPAGHVEVTGALSHRSTSRAFDAVIGNPPWGVDVGPSSGDLALLPPAPFAGRRDSSLLFLHLAAEAARDDGAIGMLVPDTVLYQVRCEPVRRFLLQRFRPLRVSLLGDLIFAGAIAPAAILCLAGSPIAPDHFSVADLRRAPREALPAEIPRAGELARSDAPLTAAHASFLQPPAWLQQLRDRLAALRKLGDPDLGFAFHDVGINYARADQGRRILYLGERQHADDIPVVRGRDFGAFTDTGHSAWLRHDWRALTSPGDGVSVRDDFYRVVPKLLFRQTADRPVATIDRRGVFFGRSVIAVTAQSEPELMALCALLNSRAFAALYRAVAPEQGRAFAQVKVSKLKLLPVPPLGRGMLAELAGALMNESEPDARRTLVAQVDAAVYAAYGLTDEEMVKVEQTVEPCVAALARARRSPRGATSSATPTR
jgi:hypothetical protein